MRWRRNWYAVHRWLGLIVGLQLLAWSVSGLAFTLLDIDNVHGDLERTISTPSALQMDLFKVTAAEAMLASVEAGIDSDRVTRIVLHERSGKTVYELYDGDNAALAVVDASTGLVTTRISPEQASIVALADFAPQASVVSVDLIEEEAPLEFRGGLLPVYRVVLDHPQHPHLYISPVTGAVLKRRNEPWRWFDFLWMLHIMDYRQREDFNHTLLTVAALLAVLTSTSGLVLWWWRIPFRRRRSAVNAQSVAQR